METLAKFLGVTVAIGIFVGFMSLVGSPHVNETAMGLVISIVAGFATYMKLSGKKI
jgi:hypothetical protein